uniref:Sushi domain-containing protein n=1 Tax=Cairina moschata TaxID=8855 RepID=A0A8C3C479_CAIMO
MSPPVKRVNAVLSHRGWLWNLLFTRFDDFFPLLVVLQCPSPPTIKNGRHSSKDVAVFIPGTSVKYECDPGYVLTGKTTVSCLPSGTWSIPYPQVAEGQQAKYLPGATVTFRCHPGYTMQGSQEAKCHPDGRWVPAVPSCKRGEHGHGCSWHRGDPGAGILGCVEHENTKLAKLRVFINWVHVSLHAKCY